MKQAAGISAAVALLSMVACRESPPPVLVQPAAAAPTAASLPRQLPRSQRELPTTDAALAVSSFEGMLELAQKTAKERPNTPPAQLVSLLSMHAQYFGALDDYVAALAAAERTIRLDPSVPEVYLQRAGARQSLHQFTGALADLARAQKLGGDADTIDVSRAGILQALGRYDEALVIRQRLVKKRATTSTLSALAQLTAEMGHVAEAESLFIDAQDAFADVSPFPLACLYFQAGLVEERAGRPSSARRLYEAAHERLPQYAPATGHLATLVAASGDRARAIALLEPLLASSDDPEYRAQLGVLLVTQDPARAKALIAGAARRYEALVAMQPAAFSDHAARYWLGAGHDPRRALTLARRNLATRPTGDAYDLVIEAALAAHDPATACAAADAAARLPYPTAALHVRSSQAFTACGRDARAAAELASATLAR